MAMRHFRQPRMWRAMLATAALVAAGADAAGAEIVLGVAAPLSGQFEPFGQDIRRGVERAVEDLNARGGIDGEMLRVVVEDDKCTEEGGRDAANRLIGARPAAVVGHLCWRASIAGSLLYHQNGIVQVSPATRYAKFTDERPDPEGGTYRLIGRSDVQAKVLVELIAARYGDDRVAIVHDGSPYGQGLASAVRDGLKARGVQEVLHYEYEPGKDQYRALVSRLNDALAEAVFVGGYFGDAAVIARDMEARVMDIPLIGADALAAAEFWAIAGPAGEGTLFTAPADPREAPPARDLVAELEAGGDPAQPYTIYAYAAVEVLAQALAAAPENDYAGLSKALNEGEFDTVLGPIRFDDKGDSDVPAYFVFEWREGHIEPIAP